MSKEKKDVYVQLILAGENYGTITVEHALDAIEAEILGNLESGEELEMALKRIDLTAEEYDALPEE
jgi:hypothetical protein